MRKFRNVNTCMRNFRILNVEKNKKEACSIQTSFQVERHGILMDEIYERISTECTKIGMTGKEFGKMLNLKKSPLTDWKNKKSRPTLEQIMKMCEIFGISADYLLFGIAGNILNASELQILSKYRRLAETDREEIMAIINLKLQRNHKSPGALEKSPHSADAENDGIVAV